LTARRDTNIPGIPFLHSVLGDRGFNVNQILAKGSKENERSKGNSSTKVQILVNYLLKIPRGTPYEV